MYVSMNSLSNQYVQSSTALSSATNTGKTAMQGCCTKKAGMQDSFEMSKEASFISGMSSDLQTDFASFIDSIKSASESGETSSDDEGTTDYSEYASEDLQTYADEQGFDLNELGSKIASGPPAGGPPPSGPPPGGMGGPPPGVESETEDEDSFDLAQFLIDAASESEDSNNAVKLQLMSENSDFFSGMDEEMSTEFEQFVSSVMTAMADGEVDTDALASSASEDLQAYAEETGTDLSDIAEKLTTKSENAEKMPPPPPPSSGGMSGAESEEEESFNFAEYLNSLTEDDEDSSWTKESMFSSLMTSMYGI